MRPSQQSRETHAMLVTMIRELFRHHSVCRDVQGRFRCLSRLIVVLSPVAMLATHLRTRQESGFLQLESFSDTVCDYSQVVDRECYGSEQCVSSSRGSISPAPLDPSFFSFFVGLDNTEYHFTALVLWLVSTNSSEQETVTFRSQQGRVATFFLTAQDPCSCSNKNLIATRPSTLQHHRF